MYHQNPRFHVYSHYSSIWHICTDSIPHWASMCIQCTIAYAIIRELSPFSIMLIWHLEQCTLQPLEKCKYQPHERGKTRYWNLALILRYLRDSKKVNIKPQQRGGRKNTHRARRSSRSLTIASETLLESEFSEAALRSQFRIRATRRNRIGRSLRDHNNSQARISRPN